MSEEQTNGHPPAEEAPGPINVDRPKLEAFAQERERVMRAHAEEIMAHSITAQFLRAAADGCAGAIDEQALAIRREENRRLTLELTWQKEELARQAAMLAVRMREADVLLETLGRQKRELDLMAGLKIEPVVHYAEARMVAVAGMAHR